MSAGPNENLANTSVTSGNASHTFQGVFFLATIETGNNVISCKGIPKE